MFDNEIEVMETFDITLEKTIGLDPKISLRVVDGKVHILDVQSKQVNKKFRVQYRD